MGSELESYTLEWVVTSSTKVTKFRVEWKIVGKDNEWQSEIAEVKKWLIYCQSLNSLLPKSQFFTSKVSILCLQSKNLFHFPDVTFVVLSGEASWSRELRRRGGLRGARAWQGVHGQVRFDII